MKIRFLDDDLRNVFTHELTEKFPGRSKKTELNRFIHGRVRRRFSRHDSVSHELVPSRDAGRQCQAGRNAVEPLQEVPLDKGSLVRPSVFLQKRCPMVPNGPRRCRRIRFTEDDFFHQINGEKKPKKNPGGKKEHALKKPRS